MLRKIYSLRFIFLLICISAVVWRVDSQNALTPNFDQSPDATVIGKQGYIPVSQYSGQPNISLPIHEATANDVPMQIGLQYDASGVAIDRHPGWVGQNWSLMAGGAVTRTVNGYEDERGIIFSNRFFNVNISLFDLSTAPNTNFDYDHTNSNTELRTFANNRYIYVQGVQLLIDSEPDMFHFKVGDISGRFFMGNDGDFKVISDQNVRIELEVMDTLNYQYPFIEDIIGTPNKKFHKVIKGFKILDDKGIKYTFGYDNNAIEYSNMFFRQYSFTNNHFFSYHNWVANTWHLTKVEDHLGNLLYDLDYSTSFFTAQLYENLNSVKLECRLSLLGWATNSETVSPSASGSLLRPVYLEKITTNQNEEIIFKKSIATQLEYPYTALFQQEADDIEDELANYYSDPVLYPFPFLQFEQYPTFDYLQARTNPMKGLKWNKLDSIIVKKNGQRIKVFSLEYNNVSTERLNLLSMTQHPINAQAFPLTTEMTYNQFGNLPPYFSKQVDHFGYYNGVNEYVPSNPTTGYFNFADLNTNYYPSRNSSPTLVKIGALQQIKYPTGGKTSFEFEWHDYSKILSTDRQTLVSTTGNMGGLRIKSISHFSDNQPNPATKLRYFYVKNYPTGGTESSGILAFKPSYVFQNWLSATDSYSDGGVRRSSFSRNILTPLYNHLENSVSYSEVVEVREDNSYTISKFTSYQDVKDDLPYSNLDMDYSPYIRFSDKNFCRGRLLTSSHYNTSGDVVSSTVHNFNTTTFNSSASNEFGISITGLYAYACVPHNPDKHYFGNAIKLYHFKPVIDSTVVTNYYGANKISSRMEYEYTNPVYFANKYSFLSKRTEINSDGKTHVDSYSYSFNHNSSYAGQQTPLNNLVQDHRFPVVYSDKKVSGVIVDAQESLFFVFSGNNTMPKYQRRWECTWVNGVLQCGWSIQKEVLSYNNPFQKVTQQKLFGWEAENVTYNTRGYPTDWSFQNHTRTNTFFSNDLVQSSTNIDGTGHSFVYDGFSRLYQQSILPQGIVKNFQYYLSHSSSVKSYSKSRTNYPPAPDSALDSIVHINYVDGLGRPIQDIHKYGAPDGSDVITKTEYDAVGRPTKSYEPISANANNGVYYTGSFGGGYTEQLYHPDPLDRPSQVTPPAWQTTNTTYGTNPSALTNPEGTVYAAGSLHITTTTDPDSKHTDVYTDKLGQVVLVRKRQAANTADTWTIYDDKQRETKVYPPGSSPATPDLIHEKRYDGDDNVIYLKKPDAAAEEYRYSARNLQIAMRNGVLAAQGRWLVTHYDVYGRPTKRGYYTGSDPGTTENPTIATLLEEYFYDGYNGSTTNTAAIYKGKLKKKRIKALEDNGTNGAWTETEYTYDNYGRIYTETIANHLGSTETKTYTYDFGDNMTSETCVLTGANAVTHVNKHSYDAQGRKILDKVSINGGTEVTTAQTNYNHKSQMTERNLGRFATTGTHQYLQSLDYTYNPQGWLTSINTLFTGYLPNYDPCDTGSSSGTTTTETTSTNTDDYDLFALELGFNTALGGSGITASQNGNITSVIWRHQGQYNQSYSCKYDFLNRLTEARHGEIAAGAHTLKHYYTEKLGYDQRGNILQLSRRGMVQRPHIAGACYQPATIDSLTYIYPVGSNKLVQVVDNAPCPDVITLPAVVERDITYAALTNIHINKTKVRCGVNMDLFAPMIQVHDSLYLAKESCTAPMVNAYPGPCPQVKHTEGFSQQSANGQYSYDNSGNLGYDPNKKVTYYYNYLNLPYKITGAENDETQFLYGADGSLLQRKYIKNSVQVSKRDYLRDKEFKSDILESIKHEDGRILKIGNQYNFEYWIKDHLGNIRVTFSDNNGNGLLVSEEIRSRNDYYPFGLEWNNRWELSDTISPLNLKRFNGKELWTEMDLNLLFFENRLLNREFNRFNTVDKLSWHPNQVDKSPYSAMWNNPFKYNDPDGNCPQCLVGFAIGFGLDVAAQMIFEGKSLSDVNYASAAISGASSAISGGISSIAKLGKYSTVAVNAVLDGGESVAKQSISGEEIQVTQVLSDVGMGYIGGKAKVFDDANIKTKENQLDRVERIAAGDPSSLGRKQNVLDKRASLSNAKNTNDAVSTATTNTLQTASDKSRSIFNYSDKKNTIKITDYKIAQDNTKVITPFIDKKIKQ